MFRVSYILYTSYNIIFVYIIIYLPYYWKRLRVEIPEWLVCLEEENDTKTYFSVTMRHSYYNTRAYLRNAYVLQVEYSIEFYNIINSRT